MSLQTFSRDKNLPPNAVANANAKSIVFWVGWALALALSTLLVLRITGKVSAARSASPQYITLPGFHAVARYCLAIVVPTNPKTIYVSGETGVLPNGKLISNDVIAQTGQTMKNIREVLQAAGSDFSHVVRMDILLTDMNHMPGVRKVRDAYLDPKHPPTMTTAKVLDLVGGAKVEIEVVAVGGH